MHKYGHTVKSVLYIIIINIIISYNELMQAA